MKDDRDGDDAIRRLDGMQFGHRRRPLRVEWAKGDGETKRREERRRKIQTPTSTLFIVNFDIDNTREADLEKHFAPYGKLNRVQIKRNYGFVQYTDLDDAIAAREATNLSRLLGFTITVEYVARDPDGRSIDEGNASRGRRGDRRSPPPRRRSRSPDYGRYRSNSRDRRGRQRSATPPRRRRRSPSPALRPSPSVSPVRKASPSVSPPRRQSNSPGKVRSRSPSVLPETNGAGRSMSRSPSPRSS